MARSDDLELHRQALGGEAVMGTWLISETLRTWERVGAAVELTKLLPAAADVTDEVTVFDVQDPRFMAPGDMPRRILDWCREHGRPMPVGKPEILRSIVESLAAAFAQALDTAQRLAGRPVGRVHIVGGGSLNRVLCQAVADRSGRPVVAGPVEATALGNVLVQARALGAVDGDLADLRELIAATHALEIFTPRG